ncbi:MAG: diacylglycerol kinase [Oscillospiraceae bacterium]|nr:diacylglycerol kinase [Oscillospiraceae bacterium]
MRSFAKAFVYAGRGVALCLRQRNFRFHLSLAAYMYGYLLLYDWFTLGRAEWACLLLATFAVLAAEAGNTALEAVVDRIGTDRHPLAARAKDAAAGAVLLCALGAAAVGFVVLWQPKAFRYMAAYYAAHPWMLAALAFSLVLTALFVFCLRRGRGG